MTDPHTQNPIRRGLEAARANLVPALVLWAVALAILLSYYFWADAKAMFERIADLKTEYGYAFSFISTGIFGGALPILIVRMSPIARRSGQAALKHLPFLTVFWAFKGFEVDALYRAQEAVFGNELTIATVATKTLIDQYIYCVIWAVPSTVIVYQFKELGYSWRKLRPQLKRGWYRDHVFVVLVSNWGIWTPAVIVIYCLPLPLQLPIQNVILCLWGVLVLWLTHKPDEETGGIMR